MTPAKYDMSCKAGTTFRKVFTFKDQDENLINFAGYTARMQLRTDIAAAEASFSLTTEDDGIVFGSGDGTMSLYISDEDTSALAPEFVKVNYVYDIELVAPNGDVMSPLYGKLSVTPEVTR
jgi:hypothetical protein